MTVRLTERDVRVLAKCAGARWLTTGQMQRLFFKDASADAVRKRLRKLVEAGYLRSYQQDHMAEMLYGLGPKGKLVLEGKGLDVELAAAPPKQREHFMGVNDIRIAVETCGVRVVYYFAAWELGALGWQDSVIPDAVFALEPGKRARFIAEYDRGTERADHFSQKILGYVEGLEGFRFDVLLLFFETDGRLKSIAKSLRKDVLPPRRFLAALLATVREEGLFCRAFFDLATGDLDRAIPLDLQESS